MSRIRCEGVAAVRPRALAGSPPPRIERPRIEPRPDGHLGAPTGTGDAEDPRRPGAAHQPGAKEAPTKGARTHLSYVDNTCRAWDTD
ncbi:hypothetical protein [Phytohabitans kaempferiae]|uniref:Uncharacterized protein n=1 Tax=Phytohabitans kaempferiae TaxID=1620943 RepID=A0ABV6MG19_9ACTN